MYELTEENKSNLKKLADYLSALPEEYSHFDMETFYRRIIIDHYEKYNFKNFDDGTYLNECGTVACALGHGPAAGIEVGDSTNWYAYGLKFIEENSSNEQVWGFLFSVEWVKIDNTPQGAAKRIYWILDGNKIPVRNDWEDWEENNA